MVNKICYKCGFVFEFGYNGIYDAGKYVCDECAGVKRDLDDNAWLPNETFMLMKNVFTGEISKVYRKDVFGE